VNQPLAAVIGASTTVNKYRALDYLGALFPTWRGGQRCAPAEFSSPNTTTWTYIVMNDRASRLQEANTQSAANIQYTAYAAKEVLEGRKWAQSNTVNTTFFTFYDANIYLGSSLFTLRSSRRPNKRRDTPDKSARSDLYLWALSAQRRSLRPRNGCNLSTRTWTRHLSTCYPLH
jgi:hypothetical protein